MKKYLLFALLISFKPYAQNYRAVVCDSLTKQALPSASIRVKNTNLGTTTNTDGKFSLMLKKGKYDFVFSYIGYLSKTISATTLPDTVFLAENNLLNEIVVMPDSVLRVLLKSAYNRITKNYGQKPTFLTGFYREINNNTDSSKFNYFSESVLKTYKPPYTVAGSSYAGQIKVLKTRKVMNPTYEKSGPRFYGGPYATISHDFALKREDFINPKFYKNYNYELEKISSYEGKPVYVIAFSKKDSVFNGKIYIDKADLAYIKIETFKESNKKELSITRIDYTSNVIFDKKDSLWYFKYNKFTGNFKNSKGRFSLTGEYTTTQIDQDSVKAFSYDSQFAYTDIIARYDANISDDFFNEYNSVIEQTKELKDQINATFQTNAIDSLRNTLSSKSGVDSAGLGTKKTKISNKLSIKTALRRIGLSYGLSYAPFQSFDADYGVIANNIFDKNWTIQAATKANNIPILLFVNYSFRFTKRLFAYYNNGFSLGSSTNIKQNDVGLAYRFVLNRAKRPIVVEPSIKYASSQYGVSFGKLSNPFRDAVIDGTKINSKFFNADIFQKSRGVKLGVASSIYSRGTRKLLINIDYMYPIKTSEPYFQIKERSFLSPDRSVRLNINDKRLGISNAPNLQLPTLKNSFWVGLTYKRVL